ALQTKNVDIFATGRRFLFALHLVYLRVVMEIVTAGAAYLDIDAYAGIIAYAELLRKMGEPAEAVSTAAPNESVPRTVRSWEVALETEYVAQPNDTFTLIDISTPEYFDTFVDQDRIEAVIDHHPG